MSAVTPIQDPFAVAVEHVRAGGLLAYPTETVWGLGADATSQSAVARLRAWKGSEQPLAVLVEGIEALEPLGFELTPAARGLAAAFWPGPLTLVLPCRPVFARGVAREDGAVGVRCSPHPLAAALAQRLAEARVGPITATSFNRHGRPPAHHRGAALALATHDPAGPALLEASGPDAGGSLPSTVIDATGERPRVLRYGALPRERIEPWLADENAA